MPTFSHFAASLVAETAFDVLAVARQLKAQGKDVIELQIGDSPYPSPTHAVQAGKSAIDAGYTRYAPSLGLPEFRRAIARFVRQEFGIPAEPENVVVGPGAKIFQTFFCELYLEPGDEVLVFTPAFPTFEPNILRRGARPVYSALSQQQGFRPNPAAVESFLTTSSRPKAIFLNSPHNPTGGVASHDDLRTIADLIRGKNVALFSDEPYCHMVWTGSHRSILAEPGMLDQCVGAFTFSKSYSMSGWRLGFAVASPAAVQMIGKMMNTTVSCTPPMVQLAGLAALEADADERNRAMAQFRTKVQLLVEELRKVDGVTVLMPAGTFYAFPHVEPICRCLGLTSHGLAMYLLEGADDRLGVACLGGECFGPAGAGFLRLSCAEPDDRLVQAVRFLAEAITRADRVQAYRERHPKYRLQS